MPGTIAPKTPEQLIRTLEADAWHSALLRRLFHGQEPLPMPPPRYGSHPWYDVAEGRRVDGVLVEGRESDHAGGDCIDASLGDHIHIGQTPWRVVQRRSETEFIVSHEGVDGVRRLWLSEPHLHPEQHVGWSIEPF